jgi:hypothetical protein
MYVYKYDYEVNGAKTTASTQYGHNEGRKVFEYANANSSAKPLDKTVKEMKDALQDNWGYTKRMKCIDSVAAAFWSSLMAAQPVAIELGASSNDPKDSLRLDYKLHTGSDTLSGTLDSDGKVRLVLPVGVRLDDCELWMDSSRSPIKPIKPTQDYMLSGGRYIVSVKLV